MSGNVWSLTDYQWAALTRIITCIIWLLIAIVVYFRNRSKNILQFPIIAKPHLIQNVCINFPLWIRYMGVYGNTLLLATFTSLKTIIAPHIITRLKHYSVQIIPSTVLIFLRGLIPPKYQSPLQTGVDCGGLLNSILLSNLYNTRRNDNTSSSLRHKTQ